MNLRNKVIRCVSGWQTINIMTEEGECSRFSEAAYLVLQLAPFGVADQPLARQVELFALGAHSR